MTFKQRSWHCLPCDRTIRAWTWDSDPPPVCACGDAMFFVIDEIGVAPAVIPDLIPGGIEIRHAICHPDGTPRRFDSKSEIRETARQAGWTMYGDTPKPPDGGYREE